MDALESASVIANALKRDGPIHNRFTDKFQPV